MQSQPQSHYFSEEKRYEFFPRQTYKPPGIDFDTEPSFYFHSTASMNPMKLIGILKHGILSKNIAEHMGLFIDANGLTCNGSDYISVATIAGGCMSEGRGAFNFAIDRASLRTFIRSNPTQDMPLERQVQSIIPREAIVAIHLGEEAFTDLEHPSIQLGIGSFAERGAKQVHSFNEFMKITFGYHVPDDDLSIINSALYKMERSSIDHSDYFLSEGIRKSQESFINKILKKHLKMCYQNVTMKDSITPYDILRYHDQNIPIYDHQNKEIPESRSMYLVR